MAKGKQNVQIPRKYNIFVSGSTLCAPVANGLKIFISVRNVIINTGVKTDSVRTTEGENVLRFYKREISQWVGNQAIRRKRRKNPAAFLTLRQLCEKAGLSVEDFDEAVQCKSEKTVSQVSRYGDRFTKNCVCVQLYGDSDSLMQKAMADGALVCVTDHPIAGIPCIVVENPAAVYADMCAVYRNMVEMKTTAVAGSIGKTTTKKMIEAVYRQALHTLCDAGNDNILDSVGSICQHIPKNTQQYVAEFSEDTPGIIAEMSKIVQPDILVFTAIDKSHIELYGSEEEIVREFFTATRYMRKDGVCIASMDEVNIAHLLHDRPMLFVSQHNREADYFAEDIQVDETGLRFRVVEKKTGKAYAVQMQYVFAEHNVTCALLAFAAGAVAGVPPEKIVCGLQAYRAAGIRQNIYKAGKTTVYADCYNAVAKSVRSAVQAAERIPVSGKRIAVLGDVAEAGDYTESTHLEMVDIINQSNFAVLMTFGQHLKQAIAKSKLREDLQVLTFENQSDMNRALKKTAHPGDLVLFKASHSGHLKKSIRAVFPFAYLRESIRYYVPRAAWHFRVLIN